MLIKNILEIRNNKRLRITRRYTRIRIVSTIHKRDMGIVWSCSEDRRFEGKAKQIILYNRRACRIIKNMTR